MSNKIDQYIELMKRFQRGEFNGKSVKEELDRIKNETPSPSTERS